MEEIEGTDPNIFHNMTDATLQKVATAISKDVNLFCSTEIHHPTFSIISGKCSYLKSTEISLQPSDADSEVLKNQKTLEHCKAWLTTISTSKRS